MATLVEFRKLKPGETANAFSGVNYVINGKAHGDDERVAGVYFRDPDSAVQSLIDAMPTGPDKVRRAAAVLARDAEDSLSQRKVIQLMLSHEADEWRGLGETDQERDAAAARYVDHILAKTGLKGQGFFGVRHMDGGSPHYHVTVNIIRDGVRLDPGQSFFSKMRAAVQEIDIENGIKPALTRAQGNADAVGYIPREIFEEGRALGLTRREIGERRRGFNKEQIGLLADAFRNAGSWADLEPFLKERNLTLVRDAKGGGGRLEWAGGAGLPVSALGKLDGKNMSLKNLEDRWGPLPAQWAAQGLTRDDHATSPRRHAALVAPVDDRAIDLSTTRTLDGLLAAAHQAVRQGRHDDLSFDQAAAEDGQAARAHDAASRSLFAQARAASSPEEARRKRAQALRLRAAAVEARQRQEERRDAQKLYRLLFDERGVRRDWSVMPDRDLAGVVLAVARHESRAVVAACRYAGIPPRECYGIGDAWAFTRRDHLRAAINGSRTIADQKAAELVGVAADAAKRATKQLGSITVTLNPADVADATLPMEKSLRKPGVLAASRLQVTTPEGQADVARKIAVTSEEAKAGFDPALAIFEGGRAGVEVNLLDASAKARAYAAESNKKLEDLANAYRQMTRFDAYRVRMAASEQDHVKKTRVLGEELSNAIAGGDESKVSLIHTQMKSQAATYEETVKTERAAQGIHEGEKDDWRALKLRNDFHEILKSSSLAEIEAIKDGPALDVKDDLIRQKKAQLAVEAAQERGKDKGKGGPER